MYRLLFLALCLVNQSTFAENIEQRPMSRSAVTTADPLIPANYLLVSDGSGFTPVNGKRTYDYGKWYILQPNADWSKPESIVWHWDPLEETGFTQVEKDSFIGARDGKFVHGRKEVLLVGSNGGIALVRLHPKKLLFYANVGTGMNPHSAALLPDNNLVVASSDKGTLTLISMASREKRSIASSDMKQYPLSGAHGLVWNRKHQVLLALGKSLHIYEYSRHRHVAELKLINEAVLPADGVGHDLFPMRGEKEFFVTTNTWTGIFDLEALTFEPMGNMTQTGVKSISEGSVIDTIKRRHLRAIAYTYPAPDSRIKTPSQSWWTETVSFMTSDGRRFTKAIPGSRIYKVRQ